MQCVDSDWFIFHVENHNKMASIGYLEVQYKAQSKYTHVHAKSQSYMQVRLSRRVRGVKNHS